jgi:hypothetical protein
MLVSMTLRSFIVLLGTLTTFLGGPATALANSSDVASTQAYLEANYAIVQYATARIPTAEASLSRLVSQIDRECPRAAAASPQDTDSEQLSNEVIGNMVTSVIRPGLQVARTFVRKVAPLHWSDHALNSAIHSYASKVKVLSTLAAPHLCADVKSWVASDFQTLPASTVSFDKTFVPNWVGVGELPSRLGAYETAQDRALAKRTMKLEERWEEFEARAVESWGSIMDEMVLQP